MKLMIELKPYELDYQFIAETTHTSVWRTTRRERAFEKEFKDQFEKDAAIRIINFCYRQWTNGSQETITMDSHDIVVYTKLRSFCEKVAYRRLPL